MADFPASPPAQVHLETLRAFSKDLELSIRYEGKGYGTMSVQMDEVRRWLDDALASNTDAPRRPAETMLPDVAWLRPEPRKKALSSLLERVKARVIALENGEQPASKSTARDWLVTNFIEVATGEIQVVVKGANGSQPRPASAEEVKKWLTALPPLRIGATER